MKYWKDNRFKKHLSTVLLFALYVSVLGYLATYIT